MTSLLLRPGEVLDQHARLTQRFLRPTEGLIDYWQDWMTTTIQKGAAAASMFYPVIRRNDRAATPQHAHALCLLVGRDLRDATTYQVTAEMTRAMRELYDRTSPDIDHLELAEVPTPTGFAWLDEPWTIMDLRGDRILIRAVSWSVTTALTNGTEEQPLTPAREWPCARIALWCHNHDDRELGWADDQLADVMASALGDLTASHLAMAPFGLTFTKPPDAAPSAESFLGLLHMLWMFLGMEITAAPKAQIERAFRRRALRTLRHDEVHVVILRRARHATEPEHAEHHEVDWSCRWIVQGHYRHRERPDHPHRASSIDGGHTCAFCGGELQKWVRPYIKGPDGLPLKMSRTLMKLAR